MAWQVWNDNRTTDPTTAFGMTKWRESAIGLPWQILYCKPTIYLTIALTKRRGRLFILDTTSHTISVRSLRLKNSNSDLIPQSKHFFLSGSTFLILSLVQ